MKVLYIVRHAKSGWDNPMLSDFERPLTARGHRDAPVMAGIVSGQANPPTLIVSSSALRAITTARAFSSVLGLPLDMMLIKNALYEASTDDVLRVVRSFDDSHDVVMLVGHNPSVSSVVNNFSNTIVDEMPTCSVAKLVFKDALKWSDIGDRTAKLEMFERPKRD